MSGMGMIWGVVKLAASKVPWGRVVENAPAVVDLVGRAKERLMASAQDDLVERLRLIHEENQKLEKVLLETSTHLQELEKSLKAVAASQRVLMMVTVVSLIMAVSSLVLWAAK